MTRVFHLHFPNDNRTSQMFTVAEVICYRYAPSMHQFLSLPLTNQMRCVLQVHSVVILYTELALQHFFGLLSELSLDLCRARELVSGPLC
jgi:hypothetical protein